MAFTSPNWDTVPQAAIHMITNVYPSHPAGSFHYPDKKSLPTIATFTFRKEKEYELSEVFNLKKKNEMSQYSYQVVNNEVDTNSIVTFVPSPVTPETVTKKIEEHEDNLAKKMEETEDDLLSAVKMNPGKVRSFRSGYHSSGGPTDFLKKKYNSPILEVNKKINFRFILRQYMSFMGLF